MTEEFALSMLMIHAPGTWRSTEDLKCATSTYTLDGEAAPTFLAAFSTLFCVPVDDEGFAHAPVELPVRARPPHARHVTASSRNRRLKPPGPQPRDRLAA